MNGRDAIYARLVCAGVRHPQVWKRRDYRNKMTWQYRAFGRSEIHVLATSVRESLALIDEWSALKAEEMDRG